MQKLQFDFWPAGSCPNARAQGPYWLPLVMFIGASLLASRPVQQDAAAAAERAARTPAPVVVVQHWRQFGAMDHAAEALSRLRLPGFSIEYDRVPVIRIDGSDFKGKLPASIWVKLEQPGMAVLLIETDQGVYLRYLREVSPGYISQCKMDPDSFGMPDGKPAEADVRALALKSLWIVQNAPVPPRQVPGWLAVQPPSDIPGSVPAVAAFDAEKLALDRSARKL